MALITDDDRAIREVQELSKAWEKLKLIPEYVRDYEICKRPDLSEEEQERIATIWGFYPLSDPKEGISFDFQYAFSDYDNKVSLNVSPLDWNGLEHFTVKNGKLYDPNNCYVRKVKDINSKIKLEVDLTKPVTVLIKQFEKDVKQFQKMLKIKTENTRTHDHLEYLTNCLIRAGLKESEIKKRLASKSKRSKDEEEKFNPAETENIRRRIKKHKKVQT